LSKLAPETHILTHSVTIPYHYVLINVVTIPALTSKTTHTHPHYTIQQELSFDLNLLNGLPIVCTFFNRF